MLGILVTSSSERTHQCSRNESSAFSTHSFSVRSDEQIVTSCYGQHYSSCVSKKSGRNSLSYSVSDSQGYSATVLSTSGSPDRETHLGKSEYLSRLPFQVSSPSKYRMGTSSVSLRSNNSSLGLPPYRLVCNQSESQASNIRISSSGLKSIRSRCYEPILGGNVRLCIPSIQISSSCSPKDSRNYLQDHSYCSGLAKTSLVHRSSASVLCTPSSAASDSRSSLSVQRQGSASESGKSSSARLAALGNNLRKRGFSEGATKHLTKSVRDSAYVVYDAKWTIFTNWCSERETDPFQITVQQLADFLVYLFDTKGLSVSTIKGYRSAISRTIAISGGPDFGNNEFISLLIRNFSLEKPRQKILVPEWDLGLVLSSLNLSPFEPADQVDIKFVAYKCCFLLALASGRRRSEIHAFSISNSCLRFNRDNSSVTLLTDPSFLAKNQIPDRGSEPIIIPALPPDTSSKLLCPVRILSIYLNRTKELRSPSNNRLFIPIKKGVNDLSVKTISTWICKAISLAYQSSNTKL